MSKVLTFSRHFPAYHPKAGQPTYFVEMILDQIKIDYSKAEYRAQLKDLNPGKQAHIITDFQLGLSINICNELKHHTIRAGHRFKAGDWFSPRVWSGQPYRSKQIIIAPPIKVKKVWDIEIMIHDGSMQILVPVRHNHWLMLPLGEVATNDGLSIDDFQSWMNVHPKRIKEGEVIFTGQIICWNDKITY